MYKKCKCGLCFALLAAAAIIAWMLYQRVISSKELSHDGSTLVKDMKEVYSNSKKVCQDAGNLGKDMVDETVAMKDEIMKEVKDVKNAVCSCGKENGNSI